MISFRVIISRSIDNLSPKLYPKPVPLSRLKLLLYTLLHWKRCRKLHHIEERKTHKKAKIKTRHARPTPVIPPVKYLIKSSKCTQRSKGHLVGALDWSHFSQISLTGIWPALNAMSDIFLTSSTSFALMAMR